MADLETRAEQAFRDALSRQADAFEPTPLAPVRRQPHARRIGLIAVAASALLVMGTTLGVALWRGNSPDRGPAEDTAGPAAGWRYESYRDVQVEVPDSWGYSRAPGPDWCVGSPTGTAPAPSPYIDSGGRFDGVAMVLCSERATDLLGGKVPEGLWGTHVSFTEAGGLEAVPDGTATANGWTRIARTIGNAQVRVLADAEHLDEARQIVDSAEVVKADGADCTATSEIQAKKYVRPSEPFDVAAVDKVDSISVCQYAVGEGTAEPWLIASRELTGARADAVLSAIKAAPVGGGPNTPASCLHEEIAGAGIVLRLNTGDQARELYVYNASCINNGFDDGTNVRELTRAACVPLYGGRVTYPGGSSAPAERCMVS